MRRPGQPAFALRAYGVEIGAHPALPGLRGFGRRAMKITQQEMYDLALYQAGAVKDLGGDLILHAASPGPWRSLRRCGRRSRSGGAR